MVADLPEVIAVGIALNQFFGWPYYAGVLLSLVTTMIFLATMHLGVQILERIVFFFVAVMSLSLWFGRMGVWLYQCPTAGFVQYSRNLRICRHAA